jgi:hypothetical protein
MPTFLPRIPVTLAISFSVPSMARDYWLGAFDLKSLVIRRWSFETAAGE